jgi:hypothetical protein
VFIWLHRLLAANDLRQDLALACCNSAVNRIAASLSTP